MENSNRMITSPGRALARRTREVSATEDQGEMLSTVIMIAVLAAGALLIGTLIVGKAQEYFDGIV